MKKGLSCRFILDNGGFQLTGGGEKASDNVFFIMNYTFLRKIYDPDFNPGTAFMSQKPSTFLYAYKTLLLGRIKQSIEKYVNDVAVNSMNILFEYSDKKDFMIYIDYTHSEPGKTVNSYNVTFI